MKLKTKLIPLAAIGAVASVAVPMTTSCSCNGGNVDFLVMDTGEEGIGMIAGIKNMKANTEYTLIADTNDWGSKAIESSEWSIKFMDLNLTTSSNGYKKFEVIELKVNNNKLVENTDYRWSEEVESEGRWLIVDEGSYAKIKKGDIISLKCKYNEDVTVGWFLMDFIK